MGIHISSSGASYQKSSHFDLIKTSRSYFPNIIKHWISRLSKGKKNKSFFETFGILENLASLQREFVKKKNKDFFVS